MNGFNDAPVMSILDRGPTAAQLAAVTGNPELAAPLAAREQARTAAEQAVGALTSHRPGGDAWKAAEAADTAAVAAGEDASALADLLDGDHRRYGQAVAAVAVHQQIAGRVKTDLDRPAIEAAIGRTSDAAAIAWAIAAGEGWAGRADLAAAWQHRRAGEAALGRWREADRLTAWLDGRPTQAPPEASQYRAEDRLPTDRQSRGFWFCLLLTTEPETCWWRVPVDVAWPTGSQPLIAKAVRVDAVHAIYSGAAVIGSTPAQPAGHAH